MRSLGFHACTRECSIEFVLRFGDPLCFFGPHLDLIGPTKRHTCTSLRAWGYESARCSSGVSPQIKISIAICHCEAKTVAEKAVWLKSSDRISVPEEHTLPPRQMFPFDRSLPVYRYKPTVLEKQGLPSPKPVLHRAAELPAKGGFLQVRFLTGNRILIPETPAAKKTLLLPLRI